MQRVLVAPVLDAGPDAPSELALGRDERDFFARVLVASFDNVRPFPEGDAIRRLGTLPAERRHELCAVAAATLDC